jgi:hypothetical protein
MEAAPDPLMLTLEPLAGPRVPTFEPLPKVAPLA